MSKQVMIHMEPRILSEKFKEVRSMFIVGVDIAKRSHEAIVIAISTASLNSILHIRVSLLSTIAFIVETI